MAIDLPQLSFFSGSNANVSYIFNQFYAVAKVLIAFAVLGFVLWWGLKKMHMLKPSIKVLIKEANGVKFDIGKKISVLGGATKLRLIKEKVNLPYPKPEYLQPLRKFMGMSYLYTIRKVAEEQYNPMLFTNPDDRIDVMGEDTKAWMIAELAEAYNLYQKAQSWFEKHQTLISISILGALFLVMVLFSLGYMEQVISAFNNLVNKMAAIQTIT